MEGNTPPPGMDEESLRTMKQSALQKWASEIGATAEELDEAVDSSDAKSALVSLILGKARKGGLSGARPAPIMVEMSMATDPVKLAVNDDEVFRIAQSEPAKLSKRQTPKSQRQSPKSELTPTIEGRRSALRGSDDARSRRSSADPNGYASRRASFSSTAYGDEEVGFPLTPHSPSGLLPFGMMPPPMRMMPPVGPLGFAPGMPNPYLAAAAAFGQMSGMPMMPPYMYPNSMMPPSFTPERGHPPGVYPPYPMQPHIPTESRGSTDMRPSKSDRSNRKSPKDSTGKTMPSQKSDSAEKNIAKPEEQTTLLIRNLPEEFTRTTLQNFLSAKTFQGRYDFIYMSMNLRTKASFGYAFVNFVEHKDAQECYDLLNGYTSWDVPSTKVCDVSWSSMHQGISALIDRYRNSPVMHESVEDEYKPAVFAPGTGDRAVFPPPTKKLQVPRLRRPGADGAEDVDDGAAHSK